AGAANEVDHGVDLAGATDERREELRKWRTRGTMKRLTRRPDRFVLAQDRPLQVTQCRARCDAELLVELRPRVLVRSERIGLPAGPVESEHQLLAESLAERVTLDERRDLADELDVPAQLEVGVDAILEPTPPH